MVRFYEAAPVEKIWEIHNALVRYVVDMERGLTKNLKDIDTKQKRTARSELANLEPTDFRCLVVSALDEMLEGVGHAVTPCDAGKRSTKVDGQGGIEVPDFVPTRPSAKCAAAARPAI